MFGKTHLFCRKAASRTPRSIESTISYSSASHVQQDTTCKSLVPRAFGLCIGRRKFEIRERETWPQTVPVAHRQTINIFFEARPGFSVALMSITRVGTVRSSSSPFLEVVMRPSDHKILYKMRAQFFGNQIIKTDLWCAKTSKISNEDKVTLRKTSRSEFPSISGSGN